ncbi:hypothetical protein ABT263_29420 [Kitasatospora sp. NPDC001603]
MAALYAMARSPWSLAAADVVVPSPCPAGASRRPEAAGIVTVLPLRPG